uniref:Major facilitator superfamily (MFS) profile domain-containing protein n=1 Tax=Oryza brachyantha TaxID=4533 RepID=J3LYG4_ORYBR
MIFLFKKINQFCCMRRWCDADAVVSEQVLSGGGERDAGREAGRLLQVRQPAADGVHLVAVHRRRAVGAGGEPRDEEGGAAGHHAGRRRDVPRRLRLQRRRRQHLDAHHRTHPARRRRRLHHAVGAALSRRDSAGEVARGVHLRLPFLPRPRHGVRDGHKLLRRPHPGLGVAAHAAAPPAVIVVGALFVPDTPASLVLRGHQEKARASLQRVRGADADVDAEFKDIVRAVEEARRNEEGAFRRLRGEGYRQYLVMAVAIPTFFDLTGMVVITVFSPVLFRTIGFNSQKAILGSVILTLVNMCSVVFSSFAVDRVGRRVLFLAGGTVMMLCQVAAAWILAEHLGRRHAAATMAKSYAAGLVGLMCLYTASFGMSWGPLKWVVPSEIYPVEVRSAGQALGLSISLTLSFTQTQVFISLLCAMKYAIFLFYAGWVVTMTAFVALFLPETMGVPLESMRSVWANHWYWKRYAKDARMDAQVNCL